MSTVAAVYTGKKNGARIGYALVALLLLMALFGPWLAPYDATLVNLDERLLPASASHWLGTDHLGRDVLSRLIVGTQLSLGSVVLVLGLVLVLGVVIGGIAGIVGGKVDMFLMRLCDMFLTFPTLVLAFFLIALLVTVVLGEGGSGGAIALAVGNVVLMMEHAIYSVISPEGCASILWRTSDAARDAAEALRLTAQDLLRLGVIDRIVPEPLGGAHREPDKAVASLGDALEQALASLRGIEGGALRARRREKFLEMGKVALG